MAQPRRRHALTPGEAAATFGFWFSFVAAIASSFGTLAHRDDMASGWLVLAGFGAWLTTVWITLGVAAHEGRLGASNSFVRPPLRAVLGGVLALAWSVSWFMNDLPGIAMFVPSFLAAALSGSRPSRIVAHFGAGLWLGLAYTSWISC